MKKYNKILSSTVTAILSAALLSINVLAHSSVTGFRHEPSVTGWDIYEDSAHWVSSTTTITVRLYTQPFRKLFPFAIIRPYSA